MPDSPERRHNRHTAKTSEKAEDQDQPEARVLDPGFNRHSAAVKRAEPCNRGNRIAAAQAQRVMHNHQPRDAARKGNEQRPVGGKGNGDKPHENCHRQPLQRLAQLCCHIGTSGVERYPQHQRQDQHQPYGDRNADRINLGRAQNGCRGGIQATPEGDIQRRQRNRAHSRKSSHRHRQRRVPARTMGDEIRDIAPRTSRDKDQAQRHRRLRLRNQHQPEGQRGQQQKLRDQADHQRFRRLGQCPEIARLEINRDGEHHHREDRIQQGQRACGEVENGLVDHDCAPASLPAHWVTALR